jgi:hypothetical protein
LEEHLADLGREFRHLPTHYSVVRISSSAFSVLFVLRNLESVVFAWLLLQVLYRSEPIAHTVRVCSSQLGPCAFRDASSGQPLPWLTV